MAHVSNQARGRLMFYLDRFEMGGVEKITLNLIEGLQQQGWQVCLALNQAEGSALGLLPDDVPVHTLEAQSFKTAVPALARLLAREAPSVLISQRAYLNLIACLASLLNRRRTRLVLSEHTILSLMWRAFPDPREGELRWTMPLTYRLADALIGVSEAVARDLERLIRMKPGAVRLHYNPIIGAELVAKSRLAVAPPWPVDGTPLVVAVGRLDPVKRYDLLIDAHARLAERRPVRLALVGTGPEEEALRRHAATRGHGGDVYFLGYQANPYAWMRQADVLAVSSKIETFPTVLLEAMAVGTPVVSVDCPHGPREIITDGVNGLLVPPGDEAELADGIERLLADPALASRLRSGGLARADDFTTHASLKAYDSLFQSLCHDEGPFRRRTGLSEPRSSAPSRPRSSTGS